MHRMCQLACIPEVVVILGSGNDSYLCRIENRVRPLFWVQAMRRLDRACTCKALAVRPSDRQMSVNLPENRSSLPVVDELQDMCPG